MTRDEAIEKAVDRVKEGLKFGHDISVKIREHGEITYTNTDTGFCDHFSFDPPRQIPPKGTPVINANGREIGFSSGDTDSRGWLGVSHDKDNANHGVAEFLFEDWNVLEKRTK